MQNKILGIDLGTTYSCVAYVDKYGKAVTLKNADEELTTPSVVYFESEDNQVIGSEAKTYAITEPEQTVAFIKREMGTDYRVEIFGHQYSPQEISSLILKKLVQDANNSLRDLGEIGKDEKINKVVITCPAYFGMNQKEATKEAGELAGLEVLDIINEPTAAAINYGIVNSDEDKTIMIYDLGGGTFDVTILKISKGAIEVICTGGEPTLGGKDWDEKTVEYLARRWNEEKGTDDDITMDLETNADLMANAEKAKKALTSKEKTPVNIMYEGQRLKIELTRDEFDSYTADLLKRTIELTNDCLKAAESKGVKKESVTEILLVGGSSKMPQVKTLVEKTYPWAEVKLYEPDEAVAKGAALYAMNKDIIGKIIEQESQKTGKSAEEIQKDIASGKAKVSEIAKKNCVPLSGSARMLADIAITNVSSRTYGVDYIADEATMKKAIANFILKNDALPKEHTEDFQTMSDNQSGVRLTIYESSSSNEILEDLGLAKELIHADLKFKKPVPKATIIHVTVRLENNGLLTMHASEDATGSELDCNVKIDSGISDQEKKEAEGRVNESSVM